MGHDDQFKSIMEKINRSKLVQNSREKFYDNLKQVYIENANAPKLEAPPPKKVKIPIPQFEKRAASAQKDTKTAQPTPMQPSVNTKQAQMSKTKQATSNQDLKLEAKMKPPQKKVEPPLTQTMPPKPPKLTEMQQKFESEIQRKIERNLLFIQKLQQQADPAPYAFSMLQSARHNKTNVLQAHLSVLKGEDRINAVNSCDANLRTSVIYAAYYQNTDAIELLAASDANFSLIDKYGRTALHYATQIDNSKTIQTIFMAAKTNPQTVMPAHLIEKEQQEWSGPNMDERYEDMNSQMVILDNVFLADEATEKVPCEKQYCKVTSIINRRDHKGRTPLFAAVAFNNKQAVETLLHLGANPHIEDCFGQRPSDICYVDAVKGLLENKMAQTTKPSELSKEPSSKTSTTGNSQKVFFTKEEKTYPTDLRDIKKVPKEKVIEARIGSESDTYLHYAVKQKNLELLLFILKDVPEISISIKNSQGNTCLHLAAKSGQLNLVKAIMLSDFSNPDVLKTKDISNIRGIISPKVIQLFSIQNNKSMTPLTSAVDATDRDIAIFLFEIMSHLQENQGKVQVLSQSVDLQDIKSETALMKAIRTEQSETAHRILQSYRPDGLLKYESLLLVDITQKNVLHHAVMTKQKDTIVKLIMLDSDHSQLRAAKDAKGKLPQSYDDMQLFTSYFVTQWDSASVGQLMKLKQAYTKEKTWWYHNTCLHVAVKAQQLEIVKWLIGQKADPLAINLKTQTPKMLCDQIKDSEIKRVMEGLLDRTNMSTKVVKNPLQRQAKHEQTQHKFQEVARLRQNLKEALEKQGISDLTKMFKRFDTNGDGYFNEVEIGCAFTVLKIPFSKEELKSLIRLTDTNNDGRISFAEFESMVNCDTESRIDEEEEVQSD